MTLALKRLPQLIAPTLQPLQRAYACPQPLQSMQPVAPAQVAPATLVDALQAPLTGLLQHHTLDLMAFTNDLLKAWNGVSSVSLQDSFKAFTVNPEHAVRTYRGGNCATLAETLQQAVPSHVPSHIVGADGPAWMRCPTLPIPGHMALMVPYQHGGEQGVVLADPAFGFPTPLVIRRQAPTTLRHLNEHLTLTLHDDNVLLERSPVRGQWSPQQSLKQRTVYNTAAYLNYHHAISKGIIAASPTTQIVGRDANGKPHTTLTLDLQRQRVEVIQDGKRQAPVPFSAVRAGSPWLPNAEQLALRLHQPSGAHLQDRMEAIVQARQPLLDLHHWYQASAPRYVAKSSASNSNT